MISNISKYYVCSVLANFFSSLFCFRFSFSDWGLLTPFLDDHRHHHLYLSLPLFCFHSFFFATQILSRKNRTHSARRRWKESESKDGKKIGFLWMPRAKNRYIRRRVGGSRVNVNGFVRWTIADLVLTCRVKYENGFWYTHCIAEPLALRFYSGHH